MGRCLIAAAVGLVISSTASAADKNHVGFNEEWVTSYLIEQGKSCSDCPTNNVPLSFDAINNIIYDLATNRHVGAFREIIPVSLIVPTSSTNNYSQIIQLLSIYSGYNLHLTIALGLPLPPYMTQTGSDFTVMPDSGSSWTTLKNSLAYAIGGLVDAMYQSGTISRQWMATNLTIEGFNEFDSLEDPTGSTAQSTPQRAADLEDGIATVIGSYDNIGTTYAMPSVSGAYSGYAAGIDARSQYVADYYTSGGIGAPNVHIYAPNDNPSTTYAEELNGVRGEVENIVAKVPASYSGQLILGETGNADATPPGCPVNNGTYGISIDPAQRAIEYEAFASDEYLIANTATLLFWRLMELNPADFPSGCEAFYGVLDYSSVSYNSVGTNLFNYLNSN